jgi:hypothetical protein
MVYNNGFPVGYNQMNPQQFQQYGYQIPQVQPVQNQPIQAQQSMTPPTIRAEIIQLPEDEIDRYPMAAGTSQMFMTTDDGHIIIKSMYQNGQYDKTYYDKRPPAPPAPVFDPSEYVRKEDVQAYVQQAVEAAMKEALK